MLYDTTKAEQKEHLYSGLQSSDWIILHCIVP